MTPYCIMLIAIHMLKTYFTFAQTSFDYVPFISNVSSPNRQVYLDAQDPLLC